MTGILEVPEYEDFATAGRHSRTQSLLIGTALREYHKRPSRQHRAGPSGATIGAAAGPDADPLVTADALGAAGAVLARIAPGVFWAGVVAG
jgi:hypothetical protein